MAAIGGVMPCSCRHKGIDVQAAKAQEKLDIDVTTFGEVEAGCTPCGTPTGSRASTRSCGTITGKRARCIGIPRREPDWVGVL
jgi:hypothetical protein